jgi:stage II sporulation protein D
MRERARCTALALAALLVAIPQVARADYRIVGHGFGHAVGLAQYGAMGYARDGKRGHAWILRHYYTGTSLGTASSTRIRVRLKQTTAARVAGATLARGAQGRRVTLAARRTYRFVPWGTTGTRLIDLATGRTLAHLYFPVRLTGPTPLRLSGLAENGVSDGAYHGDLVLQPSGADIRVVNDVGLESYLFGVVPAEMPGSWATEALRAQAIVARSYALTSRRPSEPFDVYADTRSQMYRGVAGESARATDAVRATRAVVVKAGASIAHTLFSSSSGGRTAAVEEIFGGPPVLYLQSVDDPYDRLSPYHDWTVTLSDTEAAKRLVSVLQGDLVDLAVIATTPTGRVATLRVTGTLGTTDIPGATARTLLGLRSTWFGVQSLGAMTRTGAAAWDSR